MYPGHGGNKFSETSVESYVTIHHHIPQNSILHAENGGILYLYFSSNIIKSDQFEGVRWDRQVALIKLIKYVVTK
jgi:hypothetical protein